MPLHVLAGPGCDSLKESYLEDELEDDDVVISVGKIFKAITATRTGSQLGESSRRCGMALYLRTTAIRQAREKQLSGFVLTSNGNRADLDRLVAEAGADGVTIIKLTEAQACARVAAARARLARGRLACEEGVKRRWFARYQPSPTDRRGRPMTDEIRCPVSCEEDRTRSGPGRIVGRILKYGERATDRPELFERGAADLAQRMASMSEYASTHGTRPSCAFCRRRSETSCASTKSSRIPSRAGTRRRKIRSGAVARLSVECRFRRRVQGRSSSGVRRISVGER